MEIPLIEAMKSAADTFYGKDRKDLVRIISEQHMTRLSEIVKASKAIEGTIVEQTGAESMDKKIFPLTFIVHTTSLIVDGTNERVAQCSQHDSGAFWTYLSYNSCHKSRGSH